MSHATKSARGENRQTRICLGTCLEQAHAHCRPSWNEMQKQGAWVLAGEGQTCTWPGSRPERRTVWERAFGGTASDPSHDFSPRMAITASTASWTTKPAVSHCPEKDMEPVAWKQQQQQQAISSEKNTVHAGAVCTASRLHAMSGRKKSKSAVSGYARPVCNYKPTQSADILPLPEAVWGSLVQLQPCVLVLETSRQRADRSVLMLRGLKVCHRGQTWRLSLTPRP